MDGKMEASVLHSLGEFHTEHVDIPSINDDEVLIKVKYCGICGSDVPRAMSYGARKYPLILGHEFSGVVEKKGVNVGHLAIGDRVVVAPLIPCNQCEYCLSSNYGLCDDYNIIGTGSNGAFAEYVKAPKNHVLKLDDRIDFETAAGIEPATIAYHAVQKAAIQPGETVVVMGCGPIGQLTIQWARIFGAAKIITVDIFEEKLVKAKELGANFTFNAKSCNPVEEIIKNTGLGADVVIETAGSSITQQQSILSAKKKGRVIFLGITHTGIDLEEKTMDHIMRGELKIQGSWNSYSAPYPGIAWKASLDFMAKGELEFKSMISHKISIDEVGEYMKGMAVRSLRFNKVLVSLDNEDRRIVNKEEEIVLASS